jgi:hypothetical protein
MLISVLNLPCLKDYIWHENLIGIIQYHEKNIIPNPKNVSVYSIIYSINFRRDSSGFKSFFLFEI